MNVIRTVLALLPLILDAIRAIEAAFPEGGQGAKKLALIRAIIESSAEVATEAWPAIERTIAAAVALFNAIGTFKKPA